MSTFTEQKHFDWLHLDGISALIRPGNGGTIVIIPGAMTDAPGWLPVASSLSGDKTIAILNRRGRAPSNDLPRGSTVSDEVSDVRSLLSHLQPPYILLGWSYGGLLAMEAAKKLEQLEYIVLYEPVCRPFAASAIKDLWSHIDKGDLNSSVEFILSEIGGAPAAHIQSLRETDTWEYLKTFVLSAAIELSAINDYEPNQTEYASIMAPSVVIVGELNTNKEPYGVAANRFITMLKHTKQISLQGQGHLAHLEAPTQLAAVVNGLLERPADDK